MSGDPSLSLALRWLLADNGLSELELARSAGVSPGAVAAFLGKPSGPTTTWLTLLAGLCCRLQIKHPRRLLHIALPKIATARRTREHDQWRRRRFTAFKTQVQRQAPHLSAKDVAATAQAYVAASAARLDDDLAAARARLEAVSVHATSPGLREALRQVAAAAAVNAEDLALLTGVSLSAVQASLDASGDGRLATAHRLFSAMSARMILQPSGGGLLPIDLATPGDWRPEKPRAGRSNMTLEEVRARAAHGEALAAIARQAGVSRQRVHVIVHGG